MSNHLVFFGLGSNLGDKQRNIEIAYTEIRKRIGEIISQSAFYITKPNGFVSDNDFVNSVCGVRTIHTVDEVFEKTLDIEKNIGRTSKSVNGQYSDRLIDIDILLYDDIVLNTELLTVPHPRLHLRDFVLIPFAEIAPNIIHPILKKTMLQISNEL